MELGMIGLGRMGSNMVARIEAAGHRCVVFDQSTDAVAASVAEGALGAESLADLASKLNISRVTGRHSPAPLPVARRLASPDQRRLSAHCWTRAR